MAPWCHGATEPWCLGALVPWRYGATVPWCLGSLVPWRHGALVPWFHGAMAPWCLGALVPALAADWARPHACSAWSLPREQHPVLAARTKAPPCPNSSASRPVVDDATDNRRERTMKRGRRCCTGTDGSHGLAMHAVMRPRCTPTWPLSAYAS
ncbi:hypothetical protein BC332_34196 [Capsicum chinense]|nr:hypothetical protein BC332_34196 [Capsicum chinense]